MIIA
jgi:Ran GTPase-activating protein (RanGAP) involved in mRNA processing and transport